MRVLILDDEQPAREEMRYLLGRIGGFDVIDEAGTAVDALALLQRNDYDVLLLDIRMPGLSGLDAMKVVNQLPRRPHVIFVTAYDEYALEAFDVAANDYLLKPVSEKRLRKALERVLEAPPKHNGSRAHWQKLAVEEEGRTILIHPSDIRFVCARGDYTYVSTYDHQYQSHSSLTELAQKLEPLGFFRVHRSYLVNLEHVLELQPFFSGTYVLKVADKAGSEVPVSRASARSLRDSLAL